MNELEYKYRDYINKHTDIDLQIINKSLLEFAHDIVEITKEYLNNKKTIITDAQIVGALEEWLGSMTKEELHKKMLEQEIEWGKEKIVSLKEHIDYCYKDLKKMERKYNKHVKQLNLIKE